MKISGIVMAAGESKRMGENKLLLKYNNKTFIEELLNKILNVNFYNLVIVYSDEKVKKICEQYIKNNMKYIKIKKENIFIIKNENYKKGQSESIKLAINMLANKKSDGYMFFSGDQPFLLEKTIKNLISKFEKNKIIIPKYNEKTGLPTIFSDMYTEELLKLEGDTGGKPVILNNKKNVKYVKIENYIEGVDIDTKEEYNKLINGEMEL